MATYIDDNVSAYFGGESFHERSHGQSFIDLALARFHPGGFYLLDEPEAALSFHGCLRMLWIMHDTVLGGGQFMIATHSPVLLAYPDATIFQLSDAGIDERRYDLQFTLVEDHLYLQVGNHSFDGGFRRFVGFAKANRFG